MIVLSTEQDCILLLVIAFTEEYTLTGFCHYSPPINNKLAPFSPRVNPLPVWERYIMGVIQC